MERIFLQIQSVTDEYHRGEQELVRERQSVAELQNNIEQLRAEQEKLVESTLKLTQ